MANYVLVQPWGRRAAFSSGLPPTAPFPKERGKRSIDCVGRDTLEASDTQLGDEAAALTKRELHDAKEALAREERRERARAAIAEAVSCTLRQF